MITNDATVFTLAQIKALWQIYQRDTTVAKSFEAFLDTVELAIGMPVVMVPWKGMWLGVEKDGYTHS